MSKERAIDLQLIKPIQPGTPGFKGKISLKNLFKEMLKALGVGFKDPCCDDPATCPPISQDEGNAVECRDDGLFVESSDNAGTVTSVDLSMPSAFTVTNNPVTTTGTLTVTGAGTTSEYIRGDGTLDTLPVYTADNGLTQTANNTQLGGNLTQNTTIATTVNYQLVASGSNATGTFRGINTSGGYGIEGLSTSGTGLAGNSTNGPGVGAYSTNSMAITASNNSSVIAPANISTQSSSTGIDPIIDIVKLTTGTPANDMGGSIRYWIEDSSGFQRLATTVRSIFTDITSASRKSQFEVLNVHNAVSARKLAITSDGKMIFDGYGSGTFTGTPTYNLQADASGNIIEQSVSLTPTISSGAVAPASTPTKIGDIYVDTVAKKLYFATGTASSADWTIAN